MPPQNSSIVVEVVSASIGGAFSASALYPLEVIKTKLQAEGNSTSKGNNNALDEDDDGEEETSKGAISLAKSMYQEGGIGAFYGGIVTSAFQSATEKALYFFAYTFLKNGYGTLTGGDRVGTLANLGLGCAAEWAHLPITLPIDCLTTRIQTNSNPNTSAFAIMSAMLSDKNGSMYKGIQAYTVLCLKPAIQYTVFEQVKHLILLKRRGRRNNSSSSGNSSGGGEVLSTFEAFFLGMVARAIATIIVFPYTRAKVMLQSANNSDDGGDGSGSSGASLSIPAMLKKMLEEEGLTSLFQGLGPELTRGVLSTALMMVAKEKISLIVTNSLLRQR